MSLSRTPTFVAGDEDLELHKFFSFKDVTETAITDLSVPAEDQPALLSLGSPFSGPGAHLLGPFGRFPHSQADPVDGLDELNFDDFLAPDESSGILQDHVKEPPAPPLPEFADSNVSGDKRTPGPEPAGEPPGDTNLEAAQDEIAQLKAALAAESSQPKVTMPQSSSTTPNKRKLNGGEVSPPKRQITDQVGPIEALWSSKMIRDKQTPPLYNNSTSPSTPKPSSPRPSFTAQCSVPYKNSPDDCEISPENLRSIQAFLNDNPELVYGTSHSVDISTPPSDFTMAHPVNTKVKRAPTKSAPRRAAKSTTVKNGDIIKKSKAAPKKSQHRRKVSASSQVAPTPATTISHRSIDELLAANFYSLNAQEKLRIMLPMLRNLDPRELEKSLAELPCIQAKGAGHEVRVAHAIHESPPTPEDDDLLAMKLTFGIPPSPTPASKHCSPPHPAPVLQASPYSSTVSHVQISESHGTLRQREALEKAALL